jgi:hypothetical protein
LLWWKGEAGERGVPNPGQVPSEESYAGPNCNLADPGGQFVIPDAEKPSKISNLVPRASAGDEGVRDRGREKIDRQGTVQHPAWSLMGSSPTLASKHLVPIFRAGFR